MNNVNILNVSRFIVAGIKLIVTLQIYRLPSGNKNTLKFLLAHLRTVHQHAGVNKVGVTHSGCD